MKVRSPTSESSDKSGSAAMDESNRLDDQDGQFDDDRVQEVEGEGAVEGKRPFEGMREYAESTMQELLAIYGLAGGELARTVSRQLPPTFLNPPSGQQPQGKSVEILLNSSKFLYPTSHPPITSLRQIFHTQITRTRTCGLIRSTVTWARFYRFSLTNFANLERCRCHSTTWCHCLVNWTFFHKTQ